MSQFVEKQQGDGVCINGGFFVLDYDIFDYLKNDSEVFEKQPLETLAENDGLVAYKHKGYWQSMDSMRDQMLLQNAWLEGMAPWKVW